MADAKTQNARSSGWGFRLFSTATVLVLIAGWTLVYWAVSAEGGRPPTPPASAARPHAGAGAGAEAGVVATPGVQAAVAPDGGKLVLPPNAAGAVPPPVPTVAQPPVPTVVPPPGPVIVSPPVPAVDPPPAPAVVALPPSPPTRVLIPKISVDAPFVPLGLEASGELAVPDPDDRNLAGWFKDAATPGSVGTAVVVAHVDTKAGPAAFYGLGELRPGDTADVVRADGMVATFRVESVEVFSKKSFPSERVYADTPEAQLRLITCGGTYRKGPGGGYEANVVVFAKLVATRTG